MWMKIYICEKDSGSLTCHHMNKAAVLATEDQEMEARDKATILAYVPARLPAGG